MKNFKSHFLFSKSQQSGIFLLSLLILIVLSIYYFVDLPSSTVEYDESKVLEFQKEIDSLKALEKSKNKVQLYPFNPNFITDYKGYSLGMSVEEIDRLHAFRAQDKWVNSTEQFQEVTKVSDSLLTKISPYFKFPEWVSNSKTESNIGYKKKSYSEKIDLNKATAQQLKRINGVGDILSERIIRYRNQFVGGFISDIQLKDVYGLSPEVIERIHKEFTVKTPRQVTKINLNKATVDELVTIQHIDYDLAYNILEERTLRDGFNSLEDLTKVKDFPIEKIDIIKLFLTLN